MADLQYLHMVSVLMPVYNAAKYIREAIDSILNQTFTDFEFLIINDGSTDNTADIVNEYKDPRIKLVSNDSNCGLIYTLNKGIDLAQGKYIARMDADDICAPQRLEMQVGYLEKNPDIDILGTAFNFIGTPYEIHHPVYQAEIRIKLLDDNAFSHPSVMMRTEALRRVGLHYNSDYKHVEDYQFWTQAEMTGLGLANLDDVLLFYRQHADQISSQKYDEQQISKKNIRLEYFQHYFRNNFTPDELKCLFDYNNTKVVYKIELLNKLSLVNRREHIFYDKYFDNYIDILIYRNIPDKQALGWGDVFRIMKNNVSLHIKKTVLKIKLKFILGK